jgi:hypothetical protein
MNYKESQDMTDLIYKCIWLINNCPNVTVKVEQYSIYINTSSSSIELWNENKFYVWLSQGYVNGRKFKDTRPSLNAMYDFKVLLKKKGFDIYVQNPPLYDKVRIDDVKC